MRAREITMATLKNTAERTAESSLQPNASTPRIELATPKATPVESGAQQLRFRLETALAASQRDTSLTEPVIEAWPRPVRAAILAGAIVVPWSLIVLAVHAIASYRLFPSVY